MRAIDLSFLCHIFLASWLPFVVIFSLHSCGVRYDVHVCVFDSLPSLDSVLDYHLARYFIDGLHLAHNLLSSDEQVEDLNFSKILDLGNDPP